MSREKVPLTPTDAVTISERVKLNNYSRGLLRSFRYPQNKCRHLKTWPLCIIILIFTNIINQHYNLQTNFPGILKASSLISHNSKNDFSFRSWSTKQREHLDLYYRPSDCKINVVTSCVVQMIMWINHPSSPVLATTLQSVLFWHSLSFIFFLFFLFFLFFFCHSFFISNNHDNKNE